jgi:citronellyl-CoA dehydrogenase
VPAIRGEQVAAIAVTEPGGGSDVAAIKTRAVRDVDHWLINGSKIFITNTANADWLCLLAVTDPAAGYGGYTQIVVRTDTPGSRAPRAARRGTARSPPAATWASPSGSGPVARALNQRGRDCSTSTSPLLKPPAVSANLANSLRSGEALALHPHLCAPRWSGERRA